MAKPPEVFDRRADGATSHAKKKSYHTPKKGPNSSRLDGGPRLG